MERCNFCELGFVSEVDERSISGGGEVPFVIDRLGKAVYITQVRVPPRPPKKTANPQQNIVNPLISNENGDQGGIFLPFSPVYRCSLHLLPIPVDPAGYWSATAD